MNRKQNSLMRFSRTERLAQLSEQEIVIERKKREIQAKIEAQKKKETEEALKKLESSKESKTNKFGFSKKSSWSRTENQKNKNNGKPAESVKEGLTTNAFSNDGSFLDQFKKLSKSGLSCDNVDMQTLAFAKAEDIKKYCDSDKKYIKNQITEIEKNDAYRDAEKNATQDTPISGSSHLSSDRQPFDSNAQLQLEHPTVVQLLPHQQGVSIMPSVNNPVSLVPSHIVPQFQQTQNQISAINANNLQLNSVPPDYSCTPKPVLKIQLPGTCSDFESKSHNKPITSESSHNLSTTPFVSVQPPFPIPPQNIPPSPIQIQKAQTPLKTRKDSELPKHRTESISLSLKANTTKKLEAIPNPLEVDQPPSPKKSSFSFSEKKEILNTSKNYSSASVSEIVSSDDKECLRISSAFCDQDEDVNHLNEKCHQWAQLVARCGDEFEDSLRSRHQDDPNLRFLFEKDSKEYMCFHKLVLNYRGQYDFSEKECTENTPKQLHDELSKEKMLSTIVEKTKSSKTRFGESENCDLEVPLLMERLGPVESKDAKKRCNQANDEGNHFNKIPNIRSTEYHSLPFQEQSPPKEAPEASLSKEAEMEISDQGKTGETRKRKRKSRWGDVASTSSLPVPGKINVQPPGKLPLPKSTLLSQLTRSDPGLIQYARQTFGSTNLSEEDWKKAEDHYKINLLYQDMVKKRAEVEKLERQGKFKYEYDSDEDTEGGTWEHKLRQQEMQATQLWAEELTRQAAGKHHIGDFLPPEELERFMEKYNAVKEGREPDLSDYKEYKLKQDNVGYRLLQKMGWNEGQGLGQDGSGIQNPVNKATTRHENQGLGVERPDGLEAGDDEYDAYRKRMMLAYRFRPNPLNNPRRPYY